MKMEKTINTQQAWGGKIAAYLFLAGVGAGSYLVGFVVNLTRPDLVILSRIGVLLGAPLVIIGILFLILDLGKKPLAFLAFSQPGSSWIARGTIIITAFVILTLVHIGLWIWPSTWLEGAPSIHLALGSITAIFALLTLIYTGMVLGVAKPIPFWDPLILPGLFLVSGVSTGTMGIAFYLSIYGLSSGSAIEPPLTLLARCDVFILIIEALIIGGYLFRMHHLSGAQASAGMVLRGKLAAPFWGGVVAAGLVIPLVFEVYLAYLSPPSPATALVLTAVAGIIGLIGGFMLRYVVVVGGVSLPLNINGIPVPVPKTPRVIVS